MASAEEFGRTVIAERAHTRVLWVDIGRGVAIALVVFAHALRGAHARGVVDDQVYRLLYDGVFAFRMPFFFLLSGIFVLAALKSRTLWQAMRRRVLPLLYTITIWTYLFLALRLLAGSLANTPTQWEDLLVPPFPGQMHLWFLWALVLMILAVQGLRPLVCRRLDERILVGALLAVCVFLLAVPLPQGLDYWIGPALRHLPYFVIGMGFGLIAPDWHPGRALTLLCAGLFVAVLASADAVPDLRFAGFATAACLSVALALVIRGVAARMPDFVRPLAVLGAASLPIFLMHTIATAAMREVLLAVSVTETAPHIVLGTTAGLILPLVAYSVIRRFGLARILGM